MLDKTYDAASVEPRIYETWEKAEAFKAGAGAKEGAASFSIVIPPPNVNGSLHMGHALNNTLQDILIRWKRMQGFDTLWQPGTDHAGIALQIAVERQMAERNEPSRTEIGREAFVQRAWRYKGEVGSAIIAQLKRLGASCDWSRERFTMDEGLSEAVRKVFVDLYNEGLIYKSKRLVNWDPKMETAISDLEVENIETDGHMWHFRYPLAGGATYEYVEKDEEGNITLRETRDYISIATTRPETMLGDGAVAVHPDDERYKPIVGKLCEIPVGPKEHRRLIPIITDEYPDPDFGSGAVKITGAHDFNDYGVAQRNKIPMYRLMDTKGAMRADGAPYVEEAAKAQAIIDGAEMTIQEVDLINIVPDDLRGLDRFEARKRVIEQITAEGLAVTAPADHPDVAWMKGQAPEWNTLGRAVVHPLEEGAEAPERLPLVESKKIMQPFGDRSKVVIEPMLTDQWFVDAKTLAAPALKAVQDGTTKLIPGNADKVYFNWLNDIQPWCISRQLWWGHQIPVWYDEDGKEYCAHSEEEAVAMAGGKALTRDEDVLDTWCSSALWPFSTLGWPHKTPELERYYKTDVLITGLDIIFFWVARMMMQGIHFMDEVPFHTVYFNSIVVDGKGKKMSKSTGNVIDPLDLIGRFGADATRFALASQEVQARRMLRMSDQAAEGGQRFATKLWNAARFVMMHLKGETPQSLGTPEIDKLELCDRWILSRFHQTVQQTRKQIEAYGLGEAAKGLYEFIWGDFCDWYIELVKTRLWQETPSRDVARQTLAYILDGTLKLLHPFMPHITEEIWQTLSQSEGQFIPVQAYPEVDNALINTDLETSFTLLFETIRTLRNMRAEADIKPGVKVSVILQSENEQERTILESGRKYIQDVGKVETLTITPQLEQQTEQVIAGVVGTIQALIPLTGVVDIASLRAKLEKSLAKIEAEIKSLSGRLNNPGFVNKAPEAVVQGARDALAEAQKQAEILRERLKRLQ